MLTTTSEHLLNKGLGKAVSLKQPERGPKVMLLTSKHRSIYNLQRGIVTYKFLKFYYISNGTKHIVYHCDFSQPLQ